MESGARLRFVVSRSDGGVVAELALDASLPPEVLLPAVREVSQKAATDLEEKAGERTTDDQGGE